MYESYRIIERTEATQKVYVLQTTTQPTGMMGYYTNQQKWFDVSRHAQLEDAKTALAWARDGLRPGEKVVG